MIGESKHLKWHLVNLNYFACQTAQSKSLAHDLTILTIEFDLHSTCIMEIFGDFMIFCLRNCFKMPVFSLAWNTSRSLSWKDLYPSLILHSYPPFSFDRSFMITCWQKWRRKTPSPSTLPQRCWNEVHQTRLMPNHAQIFSLGQSPSQKLSLIPQIPLEKYNDSSSHFQKLDDAILENHIGYPLVWLIWMLLILNYHDHTFLCSYTKDRCHMCACQEVGRFWHRGFARKWVAASFFLEKIF